MKSLRIYFASLLIVFVVAGCAQGLTGTEPTSQPQATNDVATPVVLTDVLNTPTVTITPLPPPTRRATITLDTKITPSRTLRPISTFTIQPTIKSTRTASPTITPTITLYVRPPNFGGPTWTPHKPDYACGFVDKYTYPEYGQVFTPRADFVAVWKVINTGRNMWHVDDIVFDYISGTKMGNGFKSGKILDYTIYAGETTLVRIHMKPPLLPGFYTTQWGFRKTNRKEFFCFLEVAIQVQNKQP